MLKERPRFRTMDQKINKNKSKKDTETTQKVFSYSKKENQQYKTETHNTLSRSMNAKRRVTFGEERNSKRSGAGEGKGGRGGGRGGREGVMVQMTSEEGEQGQGGTGIDIANRHRGHHRHRANKGPAGENNNRTGRGRRNSTAV